MPSEQLAQLVATLRGLPAIETLSVEETRRLFEGFFSPFEGAFAQYRKDRGLRTEPVNMEGVPGEWISGPVVSEAPVILYLHGGGYVCGSIATHRDLNARLAAASAGRTLAVDYRLAPEHPFPAAVEDALIAYRWLIDGVAKPSQVVIAGESAGGGLTAALLVALRDARDPLPAAGICISPWTDLVVTGESVVSRDELDPLVSGEQLRQNAAYYLGDRDRRTPLASPLYADLRGLPPLLIQVGSAEVLHDDATRFAERAKAAGVDVTLEVWEDMVHMWHMVALLLPEGQQAIDRIGEFVREHAGKG